MAKIVKLKPEGAVVIPPEILEELGFEADMELHLSVVDGKLVIQRAPNADEWAALFKDIPSEHIELDEHGHYDPKKAPEFHKWMQGDD